MTYEDRANHIASLIEERLGVRGKTLEAKLQRAGRLLPRDIRHQAAALVEAVKLQKSPKLARMINEDQSLKSYENCEYYLSRIDPWDRRKGRLVSFLSTNAFNLLAIAGLFVAVLVWRDLI